MKKILFFVRGVPSHAELMEAQDKYALIRDCTAWHEGDCFEECDLVIGKAENIPEPYKQLWDGQSQKPEQDEDAPEEDAPETVVPIARGRKSKPTD